MALSKAQAHQIKDNLDNCKRPLFFFDDDQDGLCSYLQLYRYKQEGRGIIVKTTPKIGSLFVRKVSEYQPDKVFVLDIADVQQDFLDEMKVPVIWIDHHGPFERNNVKYFNPRVSNFEDNHPTSYLCYQAVQQDLWLATVGCIADWFMPPFIEELKEKYPDMIGEQHKTVVDILYNTKLGHLIRVVSFILKGKNDDVHKSIKVMEKIASPYEVLNQETAQGRFLYKRYEQANKLFEPLQKEIMAAAGHSNDKLVVYTYKDDKTSFTSDLSNEAVYRFPDKIIIVAREKNNEMKCSLRSTKISLPPLIEKALAGLGGYGGGHENACGLNVKSSDFEEFLRRFKEMI